MIVVFGSVNADYFLNIDAFPAPRETVLTPTHVVKAGGKGANQAAAASRAGAKTSMIARIGEDSAAAVPMAAFKAAGVDVSYIKTCEKPTAMAMIMVDRTGENSIVVSMGANTCLTANDVPEDLLSAGTTLIMQMEVPPEENFKLLEKAKAKGARTILNVAPAKAVPESALKLVDYLILNEIEAAAVYENVFKKTAPDAEQTAPALAEKTGGACLITLGGDGALAARDGKTVKVSCLKIRPVDTTGAGDAFVGIFGAMIDEGMALSDAMRYASAGAGLACLKTGAQEGLPARAQIEEKIGEIRLS